MNLDALINRKFDTITHAYSAKDTMLYALGVGAGRDPVDPMDLRYTYEKDLMALPTMSCVLASPGPWMADPAIGIDFVRFLHGEQKIQLTGPLPTEGRVHGTFRVIGVKDRGAEKGSTLYFEKVLTDDGGREVARVWSTYVMRGDGGCGDFGEAFAPLAAMPDRAPDRTIEVPTEDGQALLYRLSGDLNPLHSDPDVARAAGFPRPIMHGLGSMGIACYALVRAFCNGDASRVVGMSLRFSKPFFPGQTMVLDCMEEGGKIHFRAEAADSGATVLDLGELSLR